MQSYDGFIYLLPALPTVWTEGSIKGIIARGGFELDLSWKNGRVSRLVVKSHKGRKLSSTFAQSINREWLEACQR